jgi:guanylate kinase
MSTEEKAAVPNAASDAPSADSGHKGRLFVVSAPSGAGKTTLCRAALERLPGLHYSVSYTTRRPRSGEQDRIAYHFISKEEFVRGINSGRWAEWAEVHGHYYGTSAAFIDRELKSGHDILLDIDVQGAMQIKKRFADSVTIFIMPPSKEVLAERLRNRGSDSSADIDRRLKNAEAEMASRDRYRHVLTNDRLEIAIQELVELVSSYRQDPKDLPR